MKIVDGACVREQNENDWDDSCFDTSEVKHMLDKLLDPESLLGKLLVKTTAGLIEYLNTDLKQFVINGQLQRHPQTKFMNDISSDQAHMYFLATGFSVCSVFWEVPPGIWVTSNGNACSIGFYAAWSKRKWLSNLSLLVQIILFWSPVRWCDGNNPTFQFYKIKLNIGYRHWCGDYRLFKQCLYYAPWWIRRCVRKSTLKKMTRWYWIGVDPAKPIEPNIQWLIDIDDRFVEECL